MFKNRQRLFIFNFINHFSMHYRLSSKIFCNKIITCNKLLHVICWNSLASSAYKNNSDALLQPSTISLIKIINNKEPKLEPLWYSTYNFNALKFKYRDALPKNSSNTFKKVNDCMFYIDGRMIDLVQSLSHLRSHQTANILLSGNSLL